MITPLCSLLAAVACVIGGDLSRPGEVAFPPPPEFVWHVMDRISLKPWTLTADDPYEAAFQARTRGEYAIWIRFREACDLALQYLPPQAPFQSAVECLWRSECILQLRLWEIRDNVRHEVFQTSCRVLALEADLDADHDNEFWLVPINQIFMGYALHLQGLEAHLVPGVSYVLQASTLNCAKNENITINVAIEFVSYELLGDHPF